MVLFLAAPVLLLALLGGSAATGLTGGRKAKGKKGKDRKRAEAKAAAEASVSPTASPPSSPPKVRGADRGRPVRQGRHPIRRNAQVPRPREGQEISLDSIEAQIIADYMEDGYGLRQTTAQVNSYHEQQADDDSWVRVGVSAVYGCYLALDPVVTAVEDMKQGKHDPDATWSKASFNWVTYLMVRFGQLSDAELAVRFPSGVPEWATRSVTGALDVQQVSVFDETHKKPIIGGTGHDGANGRVHIRFRRDAAGKLDSQGDTLPCKGQMKVKYTKESRFCCGSMIWVGNDGTEEGRRLPTFDYSEKWLESIDDFEAKKKALVAEAKKQSVGGCLTLDQRAPSMKMTTSQCSRISARRRKEN